MATKGYALVKGDKVDVLRTTLTEAFALQNKANRYAPTNRTWLYHCTVGEGRAKLGRKIN